MIALWIACGALGTILIAVLIKWIMLKGDVRQMSQKLNNIMQTDTNAQLSTSTFDKDISALIGSANTLLAKSRRDFIEARRIEDDLKRAITNISHDLRTPLTSAKGYLQMLEGLTGSAAQAGKLGLAGTPTSMITTAHNPGKAPAGINIESVNSMTIDPETAARYLAIIRGRLETLTALMDNLFAFSRALEGNITVAKVNIGSVLRDALSDSFGELEQKGFKVESSIPDTPVYSPCDEDALKRILQNLFKNAYVHGKDYLRVSLTGHTIEIANKAHGLEELDVSRIFDRFYTADAARTHKRTGLGLAITKELTERMGGSVLAELGEGMLAISVILPGYYRELNEKQSSPSRK